MAEFNFLLLSTSFQQNSNTKIEVCESINRLFLLKEKLNSYKENLFRKNDIYSIEILDSKPIYEVLYDQTLDGDCKFMLSNIIDRAKEFQDNLVVSSCVGLNYMDNENCIYSIDDWFEFHYERLSSNFRDEEIFFIELGKYFPNLEFHSDIQNSLKTLEGGCKNFILYIVKSLRCLDKHLCKDIKDTNNNLTKALKKVSSRLGLDVTLEGDVKRKTALSFLFLDSSSDSISVYCESHVKLSKSSNLSDSKWYPNRIYFHQGLESVKDGKILIGHIGKHL